jgi:hypothetical protein
MAKIPAGILGRVSGKVGDVVGASWKGIAYIRQFVIPANPNTVDQQAERTLFADLVAMAKTLLGNVLQVYWDPFLKKNSGWAHFIGINRKLYTTSGDYSTVHISEGILEGSVMTGAVYAAGDVAITFSTTAVGNGSATDVACLYVYDKVNKVGFFDDSSARSGGTAGVTVGVGRTAANLCAYLFFVDSNSDPTMVSYSDYHAVS